MSKIKIFDSSLEFHGSDGLGDQFGRLRANNVDAENFPVVGVGNIF